MNLDFTKDLDKELAAKILKNVSTGIALFNSVNLDLRWCNVTFKKQTWFGAAGRTAQKVNINDFFEEKDHKLIHDLFSIALSFGQAYDYQRKIRRGPVGSFPAEIKLHKIIIPNDEVLICMEILDLSITKMYDELQDTYAQIREKMADLMAAQAELHHSVRMNTISEIGSDIAHQLINPITMCKGILETQILPTLTSNQCIEDMNNALKYMLDIQNLAIWFRKFSDPKISSIQISNVSDLINDTLMLNVNRFTTKGISYSIEKSDKYNPVIIANPVNFIMWLNASFAELVNNIDPQENKVYIKITEIEGLVNILVQSNCQAGAIKNVSAETLEKFVKKMPGGAKLDIISKDANIIFSLTINPFKEEALKDEVVEIGKTSLDVPYSSSEKPLVLIVDDEQDIRKLVKRALKQAGFETIEAEDGLQALDYFHKEESKAIANRIAVIVSDVRMPRMTGPHFLIALREEKITLPFIFFSSNLVDQGDKGFKYENVFYLTKEAGLDELKKLVGKCMPPPNL